MSNPVIVNLLPESQFMDFPAEIQVVGKFVKDSRYLDYKLTGIRAAGIVQEIEKAGTPTALTFYMHENWQSFAIVQAVSGYFNVHPHVVVVFYPGMEIDLVDFYDSSLFLQLIKGGGELSIVLENPSDSNPIQI